jgi:hypothetical protein
MAKIAITFGGLLIALGLGVHFAATESWYPRVAMLFGVAILGLGVAALKDSFRKGAMHAAVIVGLVGFLSMSYSFVELAQLFASQAILFLRAAVAVLCGLFVALCVKSFIDARRRPKEANGPQLDDASR